MAVNAAYKGKVYVTSYSSDATTGEACSLVSGKTYQLDSAAKQLIDPLTAVVVKDNGSTVSAGNIIGINYLFGYVTFDSGYTVTGPVTMDFSYFPRVEIATIMDGSHTVEVEELDISVWGVIYKQYIAGQVMANIDFTVEGTYKTSIEGSEDLNDLFIAGRMFCFEWQLNGDSPTTVEVWRAYGFVTNVSMSAAQGGVLQYSLTFRPTSVKSVEGYNVGIHFYTV